MNSLVSPLLEPGPAQSEFLIHFCGRPPGTSVSWSLPLDIAQMSPWQRLENILWEGQIRASIPFGATRPMVCLSESPREHLHWLINTRGFPPWGLSTTRGLAYSVDGGPVWYARRTQMATLTDGAAVLGNPIGHGPGQ